jgi:hypothetical protein
MGAFNASARDGAIGGDTIFKIGDQQYAARGGKGGKGGRGSNVYKNENQEVTYIVDDNDSADIIDANAGKMHAGASIVPPSENGMDGGPNAVKLCGTAKTERQAILDASMRNDFFYSERTADGDGRRAMVDAQDSGRVDVETLKAYLHSIAELKGVGGIGNPGFPGKFFNNYMTAISENSGKNESSSKTVQTSIEVSGEGCPDNTAGCNSLRRGEAGQPGHAQLLCMVGLGADSGNFEDATNYGCD